MLGPGHPDTVAARADLAHAYRAAGQPAKALPLYERIVTDRERALGADHPETLAAHGNLAYAYRTMGRLKDALSAYRHTLAGRSGPRAGATRTPSPRAATWPTPASW